MQGLVNEGVDLEALKQLNQGSPLFSHRISNFMGSLACVGKGVLHTLI